VIESERLFFGRASVSIEKPQVYIAAPDHVSAPRDSTVGTNHLHSLVVCGIRIILMPRLSTAPKEDGSRRKFFQRAAAGAVSGLAAAAAMELVVPSPAMAQSTLTPEKALNELLEGNKRFVAGCLTSFGKDLAILRHRTSEKQEPFAAVLSCADSRVPVEIIFDQTIGHIFVTRNAGNVTTSEIIASLEYGVAVLGVKALLVMGHASCGAVAATIEAKEVPGQISALYPHIQPAIDLAGPDLEAATKANAKLQAALLREASTVISSAVKEDRLLVRAAFYNITSGVVSLLE
jgi:carbonic anhydrase